MKNNDKRKRKEDENGSTSITSPPSTKKDVREASDTEVKNIPFVNLISESDPNNLTCNPKSTMDTLMIGIPTSSGRQIVMSKRNE
ncbi:hypothetical protein TSUD_22090 [Trifolium subterraneum]|uniref:Uncharacterized protein n=1 Tax=Trifolium subterraneum TaxID=3900 RepID=A0A2Z6MPX8_TRISU|nr:hypothetical protein TSUD_22090 [Trifolium subterraneum]